MFATSRRGAGLVAALGLFVGLSALGVPGLADAPQIVDDADDAYRYPDSPVGQPAKKPPNPLMSNPAADMLSVAFTNAAPRQPGHDGGYSVAVTVAGEPHATYNYLVGGMWGDDDCYVIHFLKAGETRDANLTCYEGDKSRHIGKISGSIVSIDRNTIRASFSFRRFTLPGGLKVDPEIRELYAMSCPVTSKSWGCNDDVIDWAFADSATTFRI